jgi:hypothetical protein
MSRSSVVLPQPDGPTTAPAFPAGSVSRKSSSVRSGCPLAE